MLVWHHHWINHDLIGDWINVLSRNGNATSLECCGHQTNEVSQILPIRGYRSVRVDTAGIMSSQEIVMIAITGLTHRLEGSIQGGITLCGIRSEHDEI
jgi:hypothetical protein